MTSPPAEVVLFADAVFTPAERLADGGAQVGPDPHEVAEVAAFHARHGTTGLLATTVPGPEDTLMETVRAIAAVARRPSAEAARVLGCHLEGPFVSPERPGALDVRHLR